MRRLFWGLNIQQYRNAKYKKKPERSLHIIPSCSILEPLSAASRFITSESGPAAFENFASNRPSNNDALQAAPTLQKRVEFIFRAVSHHPERQSLPLDPERSFHDMTLAQLDQELSMRLGWSQFRYLHFVLVAPNTYAEETVCRGREDRFDALKRHFTAFMQECIADAPCGKVVFIDQAHVIVQTHNTFVANGADAEEDEDSWDHASAESYGKYVATFQDSVGDEIAKVEVEAGSVHGYQFDNKEAQRPEINITNIVPSTED
ncbi:hypothetical protein J7T55_000239 [Diaporthe amygdali]|uniref:uncharacterized protein n=1 Tax=Phomopsis amygdali TaxID=1214568 RepID=UPI0022FF3274|nr:uncharacterized protein J7T55_000239 [Diaporthe amygdali]KAJ0103730.1 hypothetical protein J7T55_000239 [Diaporthe amygdali]